MASRKKIAVVAGGDSSEIVVSKKSAEGILSFIDPELFECYLVLLEQGCWRVLHEGEQYEIDRNDFSFIGSAGKVVFDCAYITIHGTPGEDGLLQGYFDLLALPYTSCGVLTSSLTFNKYVCNHYLKSFGVKVARSVQLRRGEDGVVEDLLNAVSLPCFVKPNEGGSSFGISKVKQKNELEPAIDKAFGESDEVIVEEFISGRELTCGMYSTSEEQCVLPVTEVLTANDFFDYEAKYVVGKATEITPAPIGDSLTGEVQRLTQRIYKLLNCKGIVRVDYIVSADNEIFLLEVNTTPGMTKTSFIPQQIAAANLSIRSVFTDLLNDVIAKASEL